MKYHSNKYDFEKIREEILKKKYARDEDYNDGWTESFKADIEKRLAERLKKLNSYRSNRPKQSPAMLKAMQQAEKEADRKEEQRAVDVMKKSKNEDLMDEMMSCCGNKAKMLMFIKKYTDSESPMEQHVIGVVKRELKRCQAKN